MDVMTTDHLVVSIKQNVMVTLFTYIAAGQPHHLFNAAVAVWTRSLQKAKREDVLYTSHKMRESYMLLDMSTSSCVINDTTKVHTLYIQKGKMTPRSLEQISIDGKNLFLECSLMFLEHMLTNS